MPDAKKPAASRRGRPALSEEDMADMRRHITACAFRLFRDNGFEAVSMRRLAGEAGCTVMTLYRYFDRKIDILRHLWSEVFTELFDELDLIAQDVPDAEQRLEAIATGYVTFWLERRDHYFLVFMSSGVSQPDVSVFVEDEAILQRFSLIFEGVAVATTGVPTVDEVNRKAQFLICALNGIAHNLITISGYSWIEPEALIRAAVKGALIA